MKKITIALGIMGIMGAGYYAYTMMNNNTKKHLKANINSMMNNMNKESK